MSKVYWNEKRRKTSNF